MGKFSTNQKITIAGIIVGAIIAILSSIVLPLWFERAIVEYNFENTKRPASNEIIFDGANYSVSVWAGNSGKSNGIATITILSKNAEISTDRTTWKTHYENQWLVNPGARHELITLYVKPDTNTDEFSLELTAKNAEKMSPFQELFPLNPTKITYDKIDNRYILTN